MPVTPTRLKILSLPLCVLLATAAWGDRPSAPGDVVEDQSGTTVQVRDEWIGLVPDDDPGTRYAPDELPAEFRRDGLRVVFSGTVGEIPPNVRLWGTPFELTAIRLAGTPAADAPAAEPVKRLPIVDQAIAFHGGDLYRHSTSELDICSKSGCFHLRVRVDGGAYDYRVEGDVRGGRLEVRSTNDTLEAWRDGEPVAIEPGKEQSYRDWAMARVYFPFLPFRLNDPSVLKQDLGPVDWQGRTLHRVKVTFEAESSTDAGDEYMYWLDPETGRVELLAYSYLTDDGGLRFRRAVNHRRVGGILFFDQENLGVEGEGLTVDRIDPAYVAAEMRHISTLRLQNIRVKNSG